jgi:putative transposase
MTQFASALIFYLLGFLRSRHNLGLEILALRQQLAVLKRRRPRPHLKSWDRLFWVALCALWDRWRDALIIVRPDTVVGWHRAGFRLYWRFRSRISPLGRRKIDAEVYSAIKRMALENPMWGAPKIHGELLKLGFEISERTVSRCLARHSPRPGDAGKSWQTFLRNHREAIAAMDFFAVPTISFKLLYCFFVIDHRRRMILHFNVTAHPTAEWICQQLRDAFPNDGTYKYAILDRDSKFSAEVHAVLKSSAIDPVRTSLRSPWQNGIAERWVGSARRECFDHVIALNEAHVRRLGRQLIAYYHEDRTHLALDKDTPSTRPVEPKPAGAELESLARVGGLHHRYVWKTAA